MDVKELIKKMQEELSTQKITHQVFLNDKYEDYLNHLIEGSQSAWEDSSFFETFKNDEFIEKVQKFNILKRSIEALEKYQSQLSVDFITNAKGSGFTIFYNHPNFVLPLLEFLDRFVYITVKEEKDKVDILDFDDEWVRMERRKKEPQDKELIEKIVEDTSKLLCKDYGITAEIGSCYGNNGENSSMVICATIPNPEYRGKETT